MQGLILKFIIMRTIFISILSLIAVSCDKNDDNQNNSVTPLVTNATILSKGLDCNNAYLIKFNNNVIGVPANSTNNVFYEINLPNQYKVDNLPLNVTFRLPTNSEIMNCTAQGIAYPQIYIETATNQ